MSLLVTALATHRFDRFTNFNDHDQTYSLSAPSCLPGRNSLNLTMRKGQVLAYVVPLQTRIKFGYGIGRIVELLGYFGQT